MRKRVPEQTLQSTGFSINGTILKTHVQTYTWSGGSLMVSMASQQMWLNGTHRVLADRSGAVLNLKIVLI